MSQTYTRQSTFTEGDTITAALFNDEYNQLSSAFYYSASSAVDTGHQHSGAIGQGGNVPVIGDIDFKNKILVDDSGNAWGFFVEVGGAAEEQIRLSATQLDPVQSNYVSLGTASLKYKDLFVAGTADLADLDLSGTLDITGLLTFADLSDGTITVESWVDEDDMVSDSATRVPTQQSVKAYVDSQVSSITVRRIASTLTTNNGYETLAGEINGTNAVFTVPQSAFVSGKSKVTYGTAGATLIDFTEDSGAGTVTLTFNAADNVTVEYETTS